jgi:hypothetical protein
VSTDADQAARALASAYVVKAADEMAADAELLKAGAYNAERSGVSKKTVLAQIDKAGAYISAEMKLREKAADLTGRYPHWSRAAKPALAEPLFDITVQEGQTS